MPSQRQHYWAFTCQLRDPDKVDSTYLCVHWKLQNTYHYLPYFLLLRFFLFSNPEVGQTRLNRAVNCSLNKEPFSGCSEDFKAKELFIRKRTRLIYISPQISAFLPKEYQAASKFQQNCGPQEKIGNKTHKYIHAKIHGLYKHAQLPSFCCLVPGGRSEVFTSERVVSIARVTLPAEAWQLASPSFLALLM